MDLMDFSLGGAVGGGVEEVNVGSSLGIVDRERMNTLEREVDALQQRLQQVMDDKRNALVKSFMKPRDIPVLELRQLGGVEGTGRLTVFLSQVESCSLDEDERQQIVQMRVDAPLALFIQNIRSKERMTWNEFKECLTAEFTDQSEERIYESINELTYTCDEDPIEFTSKLKCKLAMLEIKNKTGEIPRVEKLIKDKLFAGMPKASRSRLALYMYDNISLKRFLSNLETERLIVSAQQQSQETVRTIEPPTQTVTNNPIRPIPPRIVIREFNERLPRHMEDRRKYCPYCRARNHTVEECRRHPRPGSCYDCLRMNCRRGHPGCPGRVNMMRGRLI